MALFSRTKFCNGLIKCLTVLVLCSHEILLVAPGREVAHGPGSPPRLPEDGARPGQDSGRAGENQAGTSAQFAAGQRFDTEMAGLPLAEALAGVQAGLGSLDDDALAGFLGGCQKIAAWSAGMLLDGIAEFAGRRPDDGTPGRAVLHAAAVKKARAALAAGEPADPPGCDEFTADELMPVLRLSKSGAQRQVGLALALRYRLRGTLAALLDGRIDVIRARIIAEATSDLSAADAASVEALVLPGLGSRPTSPSAWPSARPWSRWIRPGR